LFIVHSLHKVQDSFGGVRPFFFDRYFVCDFASNYRNLVPGSALLWACAGQMSLRHAVETSSLLLVSFFVGFSGGLSHVVDLHRVWVVCRLMSALWAELSSVAVLAQLWQHLALRLLVLFLLLPEGLAMWLQGSLDSLSISRGIFPLVPSAWGIEVHTIVEESYGESSFEFVKDGGIVFLVASFSG